MSGICGIAKANRENLISASLLSPMCQTMVHRGPDDEGLLLQKNVALAARRLSVNDLQEGHQPLANEDGSVWVVHNGEIYNFQSLRKELESLGHAFSTRTDTEVIIHGYEEWGVNFVQRFRGMFAFALWDKRQDQLILARDRLGIKPLYYTLLEADTLVFGSELRAILAHPRVKRALEPQALNLFLTLEYIPTPLSIFKNILKLPPGCLLLFKQGKTQITKYWEIQPEESIPQEISKKTLTALMDELFELLKEAVQLSLVSDVPLGAFLSGGMDSSTVIGLMHELGTSPLKTFSIGFDDPTYDELTHARRIVQKFQTTHEEFIIRPEPQELIKNLIHHLDEPLADFSVFPTYLVSKMARSQVKVILSGDGGDELFGGYEHYQAQKLSEFPFSFLFHRTLPSVVKNFSPSSKKKGLWNKLRRYCQGFEHSPAERHLRWMMLLPPESKKFLYSKDFVQELGGIEPVHKMDPFQEIFCRMNRFDAQNGECYLDLKTYLVDDILVKVDRMSMAVSLETRVPLLDHRVVEFAFRIPGKFKLRGLTTKWIFKKTMERLLPHQNIYRSKQGFSIPMKHWLRKELKDLMFEYLTQNRIRSQGYFNFEYIKKMKDLHLQGKENFSHQLWALLVFEMWKERYL